MNFKVGDFVLCIDLQYQNFNLESNKPYQILYEVTHVFQEGDSLQFVSINESQPAISADRFRLATPEEIEYYNFPDKLKGLLNE